MVFYRKGQSVGPAPGDQIASAYGGTSGAMGLRDSPSEYVFAQCPATLNQDGIDVADFIIFTDWSLPLNASEHRLTLASR